MDKRTTDNGLACFIGRIVVAVFVPDSRLLAIAVVPFQEVLITVDVQGQGTSPTIAISDPLVESQPLGQDLVSPEAPTSTVPHGVPIIKAAESTVERVAKHTALEQNGYVVKSLSTIIKIIIIKMFNRRSSVIIPRTISDRPIDSRTFKFVCEPRLFFR